MKKHMGLWIVGGLAVGTVAWLYYYGKKVADSGPVTTGLGYLDAVRMGTMSRRRSVGYLDVNKAAPMIDAVMGVRRYR